MKYTLLTTAAVLAMGIAPAMAEDGRVSQATLSALGLGQMEVLSDADGMQVRGMSSSAMTMGTSLVFGQLIDPATKSFVVASDINTAGATAENAGKGLPSSAQHVQGSGVALTLNVATLHSSISSNLSGISGGLGSASSF